MKKRKKLKTHADVGVNPYDRNELITFIAKQMGAPAELLKIQVSLNPDSPTLDGNATEIPLKDLELAHLQTLFFMFIDGQMQDVQLTPKVKQ